MDELKSYLDTIVEELREINMKLDKISSSESLDDIGMKLDEILFRIN